MNPMSVPGRGARSHLSVTMQLERGRLARSARPHSERERFAHRANGSLKGEPKAAYSPTVSVRRTR